MSFDTMLFIPSSFLWLLWGSRLAFLSKVPITVYRQCSRDQLNTHGLYWNINILESTFLPSKSSIFSTGSEHTLKTLSAEEYDETVFLHNLNSLIQRTQSNITSYPREATFQKILLLHYLVKINVCCILVHMMVYLNISVII
jgi:hypothetical protein